MFNKIEEKKKKLDEQIEKKLLYKKMLIAKEKRKRAAKFSNIGRLAYQANIDQIDEEILFGAFLEIARNQTEKIQEWKNNTQEFYKNQSKNSDRTFIISFLEEPNQDIKIQLKENKFTWNRFRKEYYGKCEKSKLEELLKDCKVKIDEIIH